ncbi:MAG: Peptide/nickel transport system substrate-binding protein [Glaciihabitans sp.]|jgi:peptide/nickel transport system substrate-binding protein|nr:Peptide/nickel transport system substrate-binding protein [Glaciihabitans sp.]
MKFPRQSRWIIVTAVVASATLMLAACSGSGAQSPDAGSSRLTIEATEPTTGLDPATAVTQASLRLIELMYEPLLDYGKDGTLQPAIAEKWTLAANGLSYDFAIRKGAEFSDGSAITAEDVKFSIERMAKGAALKTALTDITGVKVTDPNTVRITLATPSRVILNALATTGSAAILSEKAVNANPDYFTKPTATSGPWTLKEYIPKDHASLTANPHYWNTGFPKIKNITYTFGTDITAMAAAVESGTADMTYNMNPADAVRLQKSGAIQYFVAPSAGLVMWGMDKSKAPFDDVRVRQAIAYMVPRKQAIDTCWSGIGGHASTGDLIYKGDPLYQAGEQRFNLSTSAALAKASALLDEAGWKVGPGGVRVAQGVKGAKDGTKFAVSVPYENTWQQARCNTEMLQQNLKPLGVDITPQAYDSASFYGDVAKDKFEMYHAGNAYATTDSYFSQSFTCNGSVTNLMAKWCNKDVDALITQAQQEPDLAKAAALYRQVQDIILDQQPMIVIGTQYAVIGASKQLKGYYPRADVSNRGLIYASMSK